jgi:rhodanese-related sulfurtransferase
MASPEEVMIRDRIKSALRTAALKAFGMQKDAEDRSPTPEQPRHSGVTQDFSKIPKLQQGSGDTPGPNHKSLIGRTVLAAQLASEVKEIIIDVRPPEEHRAGHIPFSVLLPGRQVQTNTAALPDKDTRVVIYDADGGDLSFQVAEALRGQGWSWARSLQGGWAEWLENGEALANVAEGSRVGEPVELADGRRGVIQSESDKGADAKTQVLLNFETGELFEVSASKLSAPDA